MQTSSLAQAERATYAVALCNENVTVAGFGNAVITLGRGATTLEAVQASAQLCDDIVRKMPGQLASLTVIHQGAPMPSAESREALRALSTRFQGQRCASATVMLGDGLWHSSMRTVVRTMMLAMQHKAPRQVFGDVPSACSWLGEHAGLDGTALSGALAGCLGRAGGNCCGLAPG